MMDLEVAGVDSEVDLGEDLVAGVEEDSGPEAGLVEEGEDSEVGEEEGDSVSIL